MIIQYNPDIINKQIITVNNVINNKLITSEIAILITREKFLSQIIKTTTKTKKNST